MSCENNLSGIESLYVGEITGETLNYFLSGDSLYISDKILFNQLDIIEESTTFTEKKTTDVKGTYYAQNIDAVVNDYLTTIPHDLLNKNLAVIIKDFNGYRIGGFEEAFNIDKIESKNEKDNTTTFNLANNSYQRLQPIKQEWENDAVSITYPIPTGDTFTINNNSFDWGDLIDGSYTTGGTFAFWINFDGTNFNTNQIIFERPLWKVTKTSGHTIRYDYNYFDGVAYDKKVISANLLIPGHTYCVVIRSQYPNAKMDIRSATISGGTSVGDNWLTFPYLPNEPFTVYTKNKSIKSFGLWHRSLTDAEVTTLTYMHSPISPVQYTELSTSLKVGLTAYYNNNDFANYTQNIVDQHSNNLNLRRI